MQIPGKLAQVTHSTRRIYLFTAALTAMFAWSSCVASMDPGVEESHRPYQDKNYYPQYMSATRSADVIHNFALYYRIHASYLYPEFRNALAKRLQDLYMQDTSGAFAEAGGKAGFIVSVYSIDRDTSDLANTNHWTVLLDTKDGPIRPILVKKISDKKRWENFFEAMSPWSTDYLVVFDVVAANPGDAQLVDKPHAKLMIANADSKIQMNW